MTEEKSGIPEILEAEIEELQKEIEQLKKSQTKVPETVMEEIELGFFLSSEKPMIITGVALAEGIWKNTIYPAEELKKACKDLIGKPIKVEHGKDKEFGDKTVGQVVEAIWDEILKAIKFKAEITDEKAKEEIKNERFKAVSMSTLMEKIPVQEGISLGTQFRFTELSLVENPACEKCFIFHFEELSKRESQKDLKVTDKERMVGEKMTEELSEKKTIIALVEEGDFLEVIELSSEEELEELRKVKKVVSYYYGYPYYGYPHYGYYGYPYYGYPYYGYPHYGYPAKTPKKVKKKVKKKASESEEEFHNAFLAVEDQNTIEEIFLETEEELRTEIENAKKAEKKIIAYYYGYPYYSQYYAPYYGYPYYPYYAPYYGYPYYGYPYYGYPHFKYPRRKKLSEEELPFEELEDKIVCRACGKEFSNFKDFIAHWVKEHRSKYGPYKHYIPYYGYPHYGYPEFKKKKEKKSELAEKFKIVFNKRTKKYIVFHVPEEGLWKIVGVFATKDEAKKFIESQEKGTSEPKEEDAKKTNIAVCPVCGAKFEGWNAFKKHWVEEHQPTYGEYKEAPEMSKEKLEEKKEVEVLEEKKVPETEVKETPKEEVKEVPKEAPKEEIKEAPKEEVKPVEVKPVEVKPVEEKKEPPKEEVKETPKEEKITVEDIIKLLKENPQARKVIFEKYFETKKSGQ